MRLSLHTAAGRRLGDERGFTMIVTMGALFMISIFSIAAIAAAGGDTRGSRYDQDDKQAIAAAEAGIADYTFHVNQDSDYWTRCTGTAAVPLPQPHAVNQQFTGAPPATRRWRDVPGSNSRYSIELIPAPGRTACDPADPIGSMIDEDGNFRIRSTGNVKGTTNYRAEVATFRREGFLDFLYFTDFENQDPAYGDALFEALADESGVGVGPTRSTNTSGQPDGGPTLDAWTADKCERHWRGSQAIAGQGRRELPTWRGQIEIYVDYNGTTYPFWYPYNGSYTVRTDRTQIDIDADGDVDTLPGPCGEITFGNQDKVDGPFHSNDDIQVSGSPEFGRAGKDDAVEVSGEGFRPSTANPIFRPSLVTGAAELDLPPQNSELKSIVTAPYLFTGKTEIVLHGASMTVTNAARNGGAPTSMPLPANGVVFVENGACTIPYKPYETEASEPGCADVNVSGSFSDNLTIAARKDIIIKGDVTRSADAALLGLIAEGFVRVYHPINDNDGNPIDENCQNARAEDDIVIEAAILSLNHSFTVDNYRCGAPLGDLTVKGVIAQKHRGVVAKGDGVHGYVKDYRYDEALKYRSPPHFLNPLQASWRVLRQTEQSPAR